MWINKNKWLIQFLIPKLRCPMLMPRSNLKISKSFSNKIHNYNHRHDNGVRCPITGHFHEHQISDQNGTNKRKISRLPIKFETSVILLFPIGRWKLPSRHRLWSINDTILFKPNIWTISNFSEELVCRFSHRMSPHRIYWMKNHRQINESWYWAWSLKLNNNLDG